MPTARTALVAALWASKSGGAFQGKEGLVGTRPVGQHHEPRDTVLEPGNAGNGRHVFGKGGREGLARRGRQLRDRLKRIAISVRLPPTPRVTCSVVGIEAYRLAMVGPGGQEESLQCLRKDEP